MIQLNNDLNIKYLVGSSELQFKPRKIFDPLVCEFLDRLSSIIRKDKRCMPYPDLMTFAFWCRRGNIQAKKEKYAHNLDKVGVGLTFHVAPSNVPINFAFSFVFSLLAGNANIVRIPTREFEQSILLCEILKETLSDPQFESLRNSNCFISYPADNSISEIFSKVSDARVFWGGDQTIKSLKGLDAKLNVRDMIFSDRYSLAVINGDLVKNLSDEELKAIAKKFFNDTYLMDQNACSSPSLVAWIGVADERSKKRFWKSVRDSLDQYKINTIQVVDKFTQLCVDAINLPLEKSEFIDKNLTLVELRKAETSSQKFQLKGSNGYFYEISLNSLTDLLPFVSEKCQTLTYLGLNPQDLKSFILDNNVKGIDRIVPIGSALDIDLIWDGYDFIHFLSRTVTSI